jgi:AcrR family transcriptional regulator
MAQSLNGKSPNGKAPRAVGRAGRTRRREEILEAAAHLFAEHGYAGADTQLLADYLQVGKGTLYRYFKSKRDMFLAAVDRAMRQLREAVEAATAGITDPFDLIAVGIETYLAFFGARPHYVELFVQERAQFKDRKKPTYFEHREVNVERWRALYRDLIAQGRLRELSPEGISDVIGDLLYGTMLANRFAARTKSYAEQTRAILDIVYLGILSGPERQRRAATDRAPARTPSAEATP